MAVLQSSVLCHYVVSYGNRRVLPEPCIAVKPVSVVDGDVRHAVFFDEELHPDVSLFADGYVSEAQRPQFIDYCAVIPAAVTRIGIRHAYLTGMRRT